MKNTKHAYGWPAKTLHWVLAIALIGQSVLGLVFADMPRGDDKNELIRLHMSFGTLIFAFMLLRLGVRLSGDTPKPEEGTPAYIAKIAQVAHGLMYALIFLVVLAGMFTLLTVGWDITVFGATVIPTPFARDMDLHHLFEKIHVYGWYVLSALVGLHLVGVLYHTLILKDGTLARMGPALPETPEA
ncbi:cytochrome b [Kordiimonas sp.]|uniref:cytochrome b n=1 Tax=Kordiimonas sp. TaxID=1970157 RepID=UPI003A90ECB6